VQLVVGDDRVRAVHTLPPGAELLDGLQVQGGGGTDFTPLLQAAEGFGPDLIVVLTDLEGPARHRPACPVLWAVPSEHAQAQAPFGRVLVLD
jgi:predicted metal-dependent peptidase